MLPCSVIASVSDFFYNEFLSAARAIGSFFFSWASFRDSSIYVLASLAAGEGFGGPVGFFSGYFFASPSFAGCLSSFLPASLALSGVAGASFLSYVGFLSASPAGFFSGSFFAGSPSFLGASFAAA